MYVMLDVVLADTGKSRMMSNVPLIFNKTHMYLSRKLYNNRD